MSMSDFHLVDPQGWEYDLQSVYSAYVGYFQLHNISWHDRTWGQFFETFEQFLSFSWPVVTVTDARTGRAHIVTRLSSVSAFLKMIKTRFGEVLPQVDNMLVVRPSEVSQRPLRHVDDWSTYKKLHSALPAVALAALKARVRSGDPSTIRQLWASRDKTFLAIDFECLERNDRLCIEWGYAAIRSNYLEAYVLDVFDTFNSDSDFSAGAWPPVPNLNYRKGHYIVSEYADPLRKSSPSLSWQYAFGESQVIPKARMPRIIQSVLSGLFSPESETVANNVVLVGHGVQAIMYHLEEMKIKLPNNILVVDIAYLERGLFNTGERGAMVDRKSGKVRFAESLLSLRALLHSFDIQPPCTLHNAGNDAFMTLVVFQRMVDPRGGLVPPNGGAQNGTGKGEAPDSGNGHVKRAATAAARFFRPLSSNIDLSKNGNKKGAGKGIENARPSQPQVGRGAGHGAADEMGMKVNSKRASMFSTLSSPLMVPADKSLKNGTSNGNLNGSGMFSTLTSPLMVPADKTLKNGTSNGNLSGSGRWLSSSTHKKRHSVMQFRSFGEAIKEG